jgi:hypothetical protein
MVRRARVCGGRGPGLLRPELARRCVRLWSMMRARPTRGRRAGPDRATGRSQEVVDGWLPWNGDEGGGVAWGAGWSLRGSGAGPGPQHKGG